MFFSKAILVSAVVIAMSLQVSAHAIILPAVGVDGTAARKDVTRPKDNDPCAGADLSKLAAEKGIPVAADGTANPKIQNFNPCVFLISNFIIIRVIYGAARKFSKKDGSREVEMQLDITGTGNSFQKAGTVVVNGDAVCSVHAEEGHKILTLMSIGSHGRKNSGTQGSAACRDNM